MPGRTMLAIAAVLFSTQALAQTSMSDAMNKAKSTADKVDAAVPQKP